MDIVKIKGTSWLAYEGNKGILIDTGMRSCGRAILNKISTLKLTIPVIFMTHSHVDHAGSLEEIRAATGAKIVVSSKEADFLRKGRTTAPVGNDFMGKVLGKAIHILDRKDKPQYVPVTEGIIEINNNGPLGFGFDAEVFLLGAHTEGSIGLKLGDYFFSGDTVFNTNRKLRPIFAYRAEDIKKAWEKILQNGAKFICPGHGKMLNRDRLKSVYEKVYDVK